MVTKISSSTIITIVLTHFENLMLMQDQISTHREWAIIFSARPTIPIAGMHEMAFVAQIYYSRQQSSKRRMWEQQHGKQEKILVAVKMWSWSSPTRLNCNQIASYRRRFLLIHSQLKIIVLS